MATRNDWPNAIAELVDAARAGDDYVLRHEPTSTNSETMAMLIDGLQGWFSWTVEVDHTQAIVQLDDGKALQIDMGGAGDFDISRVQIAIIEVTP